MSLRLAPFTSRRLTRALLTGAVYLSFLAPSWPSARAQGAVPTFQYAAGNGSYTLLGRDPGKGGVTVIPTLLVPITLSFDAKKIAGKPFVMDANADMPAVLRSPVFSKFPFSSGNTQYADAMLRATFPNAKGWHTLLGDPTVKPVAIEVPAGDGYVLTSKRSGRSIAVVDVGFLQNALFKQLSRQDGKLVIAVTHNTTYYTAGDDTLCCSWGTHGVDAATGSSFIIGTYLNAAPGVVEDADVQPLTQQLAEFVNDPLHDPLLFGWDVKAGNVFPAWMPPGSDRRRCGGTGDASAYFLLEPTSTNPKNNFPASNAFVAQAGGTAFHLENVALLPWYIGASQGLGGAYSFPDAQALAAPANPCPSFGRRTGRGRLASAAEPAVAAIPAGGVTNGHHLIGYWTGGGGMAASSFPLRNVSSQWDIMIVAFATPDRNAPLGTMQFDARSNAAQLKANIAYMKSQGKKVMISLGGGGENFSLSTADSVSAFVSSVSRIVAGYGFDGVDIDFETPSLLIDPGDTDFRHPTTQAIVNLISALRQLHDRFGPGFMISVVPEGTQIPAAYPTYGGQFGSELPIIYAIKDILTFVDVQDYNTPPLEGLDGEIYQPGTVDYHAAMTELLLHGFNVGGDPKHFFPPMPADQVAVGFLTGDTTPAIVSQAMDYIITGRAPAGTEYKLRRPEGYRGMIGAMFWTINADRRGNYEYSNVIGPELHSFPPPASSEGQQ